MPQAERNSEEMMPYADDKNLNAITNPAIRTPWPRVGGRALKIEPNGFFGSREFADAWKPGPNGIIYAAGCQGTHHLAKTISMPVYKLGFTTIPLRARLSHLGRDRYGAGRVVNGTVLIEPGHDEWAAAQIRVSLPLSASSPVASVSRGISVTLPATYTVREFDRDLSAALRSVELAAFAQTDVGRVHCAALGVDPSDIMRVTPYDFAGHTRISQARELAVFRPEIDGDRIVVLVESLIAAHLSQAQ